MKSFEEIYQNSNNLIIELENRAVEQAKKNDGIRILICIFIDIIIPFGAIEWKYLTIYRKIYCCNDLSNYRYSFFCCE